MTVGLGLWLVIALSVANLQTARAEEGDAGGRVHVSGFRFKGNTVLRSEELEAAVAGFIGRDCDLAELRKAADQVTDEYLKRGYSLATAYLPAQDVSGGVVEIVIVEGRLGRVIVEGNKYVSAGFIARALRNLEGEVVTNAALERDLLLLNGCPGLQVKAYLQPGAEAGTVDLRAQAEEAFPIHLTLDANNYGTQFTSRGRIGAQLDWNNAFLSGGLLSLRAVVGDDPRLFAYGRGSYVLALSGCGARVGVWGSKGDFEVSRDLQDLHLTGETAEGGVYANFPWIRSRTMGLTTELGFDVKDSELLLGETPSSNDEIRLARMAGSFDHAFWEGRLYASATIHQGLGEVFGGLEEDDRHASRPDADNSFTHFDLDVARVQRVSDTFSFLVRGSGQVSSEPLVAGEQMSIGGADSVRGYPQGEFAGDDGANASFELRAAPLNDKGLLQLVAFFDWGMVHRKLPATGQPNDQHLTGTGVGLRISPPWQDASIRFDVGWPLEDEPSDGREPQFYLAGSLRF